MFKGMEYVYAVNKERSFSKAAEKLYISQPSLSASIKRIEKKIGCPIFDRSCTPLRLTECGEEYIRCMIKIMDLEEGFKNYVNNLETLKSGRLRIGGGNFLISFILPPLISIFTQSYPAVQIELVETTTAQLEKQLVSGELELIIDNTYPKELSYEKQLLLTEHLMLAVPQKFIKSTQLADCYLTQKEILGGKHLEKNAPAVQLSSFITFPFILLKLGNDTRQRADLLLKREGLTPHTLLEVDQQLSGYNIANQGMGVTFVSDTLIKKVAPSPGTVFYKLEGLDTRREINFFYRRGKYLTRAMSEFLKLAAESSL